MKFKPILVGIKYFVFRHLPTGKILNSLNLDRLCIERVLKQLLTKFAMHF